MNELKRESRLPPLSLVERLWAKVERDPGPGCWRWTGCVNEKGYGRMAAGDDGRLEYVHRVSWELAFGPVADGLWVLHRCDNPPCIRPSHLFLGTNQDNVDDKFAKGRQVKTQLSMDLIEAVRKAYIPRVVTTGMLAKSFGISKATAHRIVTGYVPRQVRG